MGISPLIGILSPTKITLLILYDTSSKECPDVLITVIDISFSSLIISLSLTIISTFTDFAIS